MTQQEIYERLQQQWIEANNLKVGDRVKIVAKAESYQMGWSNTWPPEMDAHVGGTYTVSCIHGDGLRFEEIGFAWPFFVLEKVEVSNKITQYPTKEQILDAASVSDGAKQTLMKLFPDVFEESKSKYYEVDESWFEKGTVAVRHGGNLENRAFFLSIFYDWEIIEDDYGCKCLVAMKKS